MDYFEIKDHLGARGRWQLGEASVCSDGGEVDIWEFTLSRAYDGPEDLCVAIDQQGKQLDFTFADFDMPVLRKEIGALIQRIAPGAVQLVPCRVGPGAEGEFVILNTLHLIDCIDDAKSESVKWTEEDDTDEPPGSYCMISRLVIDPERANNEHIFRLAGWDRLIIVSRELRNALAEAKVSGILFSESCSG